MKYKNMLNAGLLLIEEMSNVEDPILDFGEVFEDRLMMEAYLAGFGGSVSGEQKMISDDLLEDLLHQYIEDSNERLKDIFDCTASKQHGRRYHRVMSRKHQRRKNKIAAYGYGNFFADKGLCLDPKKGAVSMSKAGATWKRNASRKVRRMDADFANGNGYRRCYDLYYGW